MLSKQPEEATSPPLIHRLSAYLIDQIKAGEVIERPAALVKEILENSLDAGADQIFLKINNAGIDLISLEDNGCGISLHDLPKAFERHATSKIASFDDLYQLNTYGFRGEALASIAAISKLTCLTSNGKESSKIQLDGGIQKFYGPWPKESKGTSLQIENLFFNTPVRLEFLKSSKAEKRALSQIIESYILMNPNVSFSIQWDEGATIQFPRVSPPSSSSPEDEMKKRLEKILLGTRHEGELTSFQVSYDGHEIQGYLTNHSSAGGGLRKQYLMANRRLFHSPQLHHLVTKGASHIWPPGEQGNYFISIKAPTELIDVNIHPNKTQIKFQKNHLVHSMLNNALKNLGAKYPLSGQRSNLDDTFVNKATDHSLAGPNEFDQEEESGLGNIFLAKSMVDRASLIHLCSEYYLLYSNGKYYLADSKKIFKKILEHVLKATKIAEEKLNYFLIARPLQMTPTQDHARVIQLFQEIGFTIDVLEGKQYLLRACPQELSLLPSRGLLERLISTCLERKVSDRESLKKYIHEFLSQNELLPHEIHPWLQHHAPLYLEDLTLLSRENLAKIIAPANE